MKDLEFFQSNFKALESPEKSFRFLKIVEISWYYPGKDRNNDLFQMQQHYVALWCIMQLKHLIPLLTWYTINYIC